MHQNSKETYDFIASWESPNFFFSKKDKWDRMGFLGVFADYVCSSVSGDIAEVGVGESSIYLSHVARKYNRRMYHCDAAPSKIINPATVDGYLVPKAIDIEAMPKGDTVNAGNSLLFMGPSDAFFKQITFASLALAFIDGDHNYEQAKKDFHNAYNLVVDNGYILLHDTYPPNEAYLSPDSACGDVYRLRQELEKMDHLDTLTLTRGTAMGVGLTICRKKPISREYYNE